MEDPDGIGVAMYRHRRCAHWRFRKAVPSDLTGVIGRPDVRRSRRTRNAALARRKVLQVLMRRDEAYAVLRSQRPIQCATRGSRLVGLDIGDRLLEPELIERGTPRRDLGVGDGGVFIQALGFQREHRSRQATLPVPVKRRNRAAIIRLTGGSGVIWVAAQPGNYGRLLTLREAAFRHSSCRGAPTAEADP